MPPRSTLLLVSPRVVWKISVAYVPEDPGDYEQAGHDSGTKLAMPCNLYSAMQTWRTPGKELHQLPRGMQMLLRKKDQKKNPHRKNNQEVTSSPGCNETQTIHGRFQEGVVIWDPCQLVVNGFTRRRARLTGTLNHISVTQHGVYGALCKIRASNSGRWTLGVLGHRGWARFPQTRTGNIRRRASRGRARTSGSQATTGTSAL